jgi:hypothetical protein
MRITSAGLVGIGTTAPALKLSVDGDVWFGNGAGAEIGRLFNDSAVLHLRASTNVTGLALGAAGLERIRIQSGGNVGIGDTAPDSTLTIKAPAATTPLRISGPSSEFARVDSSGRLLVGTSTGRGVGSSIQALTQVETTNYVAYSAVNNANDGGSIGLMLGKSRGTAVGSNTIVQNNDNLGDIYFAGADGTDLESVAARITCSVDGTPGANDMPGRLVFSTTADGAASPTERMRIKENGNVWIGNTADLTSSVNRLSIQGSRCIDAKSTGGATGTLATFWNNASTGDNEFLSFRTETSDTIRGTITYNRAGGVVAYNTTSDYRSKIISGNIEDTGTTIDAFKVYRGVMNGATIERPMLIAHEAQEVAPYCVTGQKDAEDDDGNPIYQQMDHQVLVPLLIAELQQLRIRVAALEAE